MKFAPRPAALFAVLFLLLSFGLASCTSEGQSSGQSGSCENALFPVKPGATWTYSSAGGPGGALIYTDSISEVHADGFTLASQWMETTREQKWFCNLEGLQALQIGGGNAAGISMQGITAEFVTTDVRGILLPREISAGSQWDYELKIQGSLAMPGEPQAPARGVYAVSMQEAGKETISTPSGTFDATRIQAAVRAQITTDFQGMSLPIFYNASATLWYAPGVGFVKSVENGDFGGTTFTVTTELLRYKIP